MSAPCSQHHARLDVAMYGFWGSRFERAFIDVRVLTPALDQTDKLPCKLHTGATSSRRGDNMSRG